MNKYFDFLDSFDYVHPYDAPSLIVEEFGIEYRQAVEIVTEWVRIKKDRNRHAN